MKKENKEIIKKELIFMSSVEPIKKNEIVDLYSNESALCKIEFETLKDGKPTKGIGTGFFCLINNDNIPFSKALFTNNHVLNEDKIQINKQIEFEYCNQKNTIEITKDRKVFTDEELDYTCIQIFGTDKIKNYFNIDKIIFNDKNSLKNKEIFILQYPGGELSHAVGKILDIEDNIIKHNVSTKGGSSGSPLIKRYNTNLAIGLHFGGKEKNGKTLFNLATPFDAIIQNIIYKLNNNNIKSRNIITLIYNKHTNDEDANRICDSEFLKNNKENIKLIINGNKSPLISEYQLKEGNNTIQLIINNPLTNLHGMFSRAKSLAKIDELKYLNTQYVKDFSYMFWDCSSLSDIKALENWNVSNGKNFTCMFSGCKSLSDIKVLENWNVSNGKDFSFMFSKCSALSNIKALEN